MTMVLSYWAVAKYPKIASFLLICVDFSLRSKWQNEPFLRKLLAMMSAKNPKIKCLKILVCQKVRATRERERERERKSPAQTLPHFLFACFAHKHCHISAPRTRHKHRHAQRRCVKMTQSICKSRKIRSQRLVLFFEFFKIDFWILALFSLKSS